jgi:hypothetical protein
MAGKRALVVTTVPADESTLREALPDARRRADEAAQRVASAAGGDTKVEIDRTSESTDAAQAIRDALRDFQADEIVVVTRPGDDSTWLEDETVQAALDAHGIPVRHRELSSTG